MKNTNMKNTMKNQTRIWWVMDENDNCKDFFSGDAWMDYLSEKTREFKAKGYTRSINEDDKSMTVTFTKGEKSKMLKMTKIQD